MNNLTLSEARHLVSRTGIGAEWSTIKRLEGLPRAKAVDLLLNTPISHPRPAPALTHWNRLEPMREANAQGRKRAWMIAQREGKRLQGWWVEHLIHTRSPLVERMTLFWHGLFTSSIQKTLQPSFLYQQNLLLRKHALGSFANLLHDIAKDPAMLVYLDGYKNFKGMPNENFARELLELFTLGRGHYRESDIKAATYAFTGWSIHPKTGKFIYQANQHAQKQVTFLGKTGRFKGADIINILLKHPRTAEFIVEKLWRAFINPHRVDHRQVKQWAQQFRHSNYNIKQLLKTLLNSSSFWAKHHWGTLTKSPIDILVGSIRMIPYPRQNTVQMVNLCRLLGQELFDPPNVKGWRGAEHWINTQTLLVRMSYLTKLSRGNLNNRVQTGLRLPKASQQEFQDWMLALKPINPLPTIPGDRRLVRSLLLDPVFQVH